MSRQKNEANAFERVLNVFAPEAATKAYKKRLKRNDMEQPTRRKMTATGYGNHGASATKKAMIGWTVGGGSAATDIDLNTATLRKRARDLDMGGGVARAATRTLRTNVVGSGLVARPQIDYETLGMTEQEAREWQRKVKAEFLLWAESHDCDAAGRLNLYQLQRLAFLSYLISGDVIALMPFFGVNSQPYSLHIRLIEADRVATPGSGGANRVAELPNGNRIVDGVETDVNGHIVAYHISNKHPLDRQSDNRQEKTVRIEAFGNETGLPNVLHVMDPERPDQMRGVPYVSPIIEQAKQLERYVGSELTASIISSLLTVFITQKADSGAFGIEDSVAEDERVSDNDGDIELGPGTIVQLSPGNEVTNVNPQRNNSGYADFVDAIITQMGSSLEIPMEVLLKKFNANYSASRAALGEFWRTVIPYRRNFIWCFCQPAYEAWLAEAVALGRIEAKGFFDDPALRRAWCGAVWMGSHIGSIDPLKEAKAAQMRIKMNISTEEREAQEFNGSDWEENVQQRRKEIEAFADLYGTGEEDDPVVNDDEDDEDDEDDKEDTSDE